MAWASVCDAVLAVGSTLSVYPAAYVPLTAAEAGSPLIIVNQGPTDLDTLAIIRIDDSAGGALTALADALT
jgi:NAD-dependent deacetylase